MADNRFAAELAKLRDNTKQVASDYEHTLNDLIIDAAVEGETYMKEHAPWRDDTGNRKDRTPGAARAGLFTVPDIEGDHKAIVFSHSVDYGIWLEIKNNGKDEIIMPSVKTIGEKLMEGTEGSLNIGARRGFVGAVGEAKGEQSIIRAHEAES
ncbi:hypothetical protein [Mycobacterium heckeshornense]|uniref:hypothetical protein n=1 Tax=Mycobacterium heckeshornense TaxID=110505 RepID=UPI000A595DA4|nr:hypothetical protein [Mycobacterium heckeshornense]